MNDHAETPDWLELFRLTRNDWRVSDSRIDKTDPHRLLGYIERLQPNRYELLWLTEPVGWAYVRTFKQASAAFADIGEFDGVIERVRAKNRRALDEPLFHRIRHRGRIA